MGATYSNQPQHHYSSHVVCIIFSLRGLLSAVDDLLNKLLESEDTSLLGVYIGRVMPDSIEWEKMRQSLPVQVCLKLERILFWNLDFIQA